MDKQMDITVSNSKQAINQKKTTLKDKREQIYNGMMEKRITPSLKNKIKSSQSCMSSKKDHQTLFSEADIKKKICCWGRNF